VNRINTLVIGGGQAGLAMSRCLSDRLVDHVVLERGRVAERWRTERWDSLQLLTPNWQTRLPGFRYEWLARNGVIATGYSDLPYVPPLARQLSPRIVQVVPTQYRNPEQLSSGGVLVVGASATGVQLADEIHASGRAVTLGVGRHLRLPRTYRGRDILWWLDAMGVFDDTADDVFDIQTSRSQPSVDVGSRGNEDDDRLAGRRN
jgi:putative flavoprotein involved in K+ transport